MALITEIWLWQGGTTASGHWLASVVLQGLTHDPILITRPRTNLQMLLFSPHRIHFAAVSNVVRGGTFARRGVAHSSGRPPSNAEKEPCYLRWLLLGRYEFLSKGAVLRTHRRRNKEGMSAKQKEEEETMVQLLRLLVLEY